MDVRAIREALAAHIAENVTGLPLTVFSYVPSDGPTPFAYVQTDSIAYDRAMRGGSVELNLLVMVMCSRADDETSQAQLDALISDSDPTTSIKAACDAANGAPGKALGGLCDFVHLQGTDGQPRWFEWREGVKYHGVGLRVRILGTGA